MLKINSLEKYQSEYKRSVKKPELFWEGIAESFEWKKKWDKVLDWNFNEPNVKWFDGGQLNITENCLDRHLDSIGDKVAFNWVPNDVREKGSYKRVKPKYKIKPFRNSVKFYYNGWSTKGVGYVEKDSISKNLNLVDEHKVFISKAYGMGGLPPYKVINTPFYGGHSSCCTETYLYIGPFKDKITCENVISYMNTKLFRFLVLLKKNTQNAMKGVYDFIPLQNFTSKTDDKFLYKKYKLDKDEIQFIETLVT